MTPSATLLDGRRAAERHAWSDALDLFAQVESTEPLEADDLMLLAESAWWMGKMRDCIVARERAYQAYTAEGNTRRAAYAALKLVDHHGDLAEPGLAAAWMQTATKLLAALEECVEHGYLALMTELMCAHGGDIAGVVTHAREARRIGERFADKDLVAFGLAGEGHALVRTGEIDRGIALLEEATVPAVSGELGPYATGWIYCIVISTTSAIADWQRAGQWTEAAKRWCERQSINGFPGICRVHRAEIMRLRGAFSDAEAEAVMATEELGTFNIAIASYAFKELGEIRLRTGDLDGAEEAFRQANELGASPQPGLALVQLQRGKAEAAASQLKRALAEGGDPLDRARLLPFLVEVALETGDRDSAAAAVDELGEIAGAFSGPAMRAAVAGSRALLRLHDGDLPSAEIDAKDARRLWKEADVLYEAARVGITLGDVYLAEGDRDAASFEYSTAQATFDKFGAIPDGTIARARLAAIADAPEPSGKRVAKTFLFSDIVRSTNLVEAIGDEAWTDLLKWHDETLRTKFREYQGEEVTHTGDGFFVAFATTDQAAACAIAIQSSLAEHRRAHGFAPQVRIGLHATEAAEVGGNYHGKGVHEAARIGALAEGGEILASASTIECLSDPVAVSDERQVALKGVTGAVTVASIRWN
jgi:class 3 adenylate cyclase